MSDEKVTVEVTGRQFRHDGEEYHTGATLEVPERAIEGWEQRLERIEDTEDSDDAEYADEATDDTENSDADATEDDGGETEPEAEEAEVEVDPHPSDLTVAELEERIEDVDDPGLLQAIRDAEADGEDRSTAIDAIKARLSDLEG